MSKQSNYRICTGENNSQCPNYVDKKKLPIEYRLCSECDSPTTIVTKLNILAIPVFTILLVGILGFVLSLFLKHQKQTIDTSAPDPALSPISEPDSEIDPPPVAIEKSQRVASIESSSTIKTLNSTTDGKTLFGGSQGGDVYLWNVETGQVVTTLSGHQEAITAVAISANDQILVSASEDGVIKVWNLVNRKEIHTIDKKLGSYSRPYHPITSLAVSADGKILVAGGQDQYIKLWNLETKEIIETLEIESRKGIDSLAMSENAQTIVSGNRAGNINLWKKLNNGGYEGRSYQSGDRWEVHSVAIDSNGKRIISSSCKDRIRIWNSKFSENSPLKTKSASNICLVSISSDGKIVAGLSDNQTMMLWNLETKKEIEQFPMPSTSNPNGTEIRSVTFSGDGRTIAASLGKTIEVWRLPIY